jgi:hypothetical protein
MKRFLNNINKEIVCAIKLQKTVSQKKKVQISFYEEAAPHLKKKRLL